MKKLILVFLAAIGSISAASAQSFSLKEGDTARGATSSSMKIHNDIINQTTFPIRVNWKITASDFPQSWRSAAIAGVCDNKYCTPGIKIDELYTSDDIPGNTAMSFYVGMNNMESISDYGTYYFRVNITDAANSASTKDVTFVVTKQFPASIKTVRSDDAVTIYPNPARTELNVIYNEGMDVKNIAVYNMIGKVVGVYKATDAKSARLNVENMPSGAYFVRLIDSKGRVAAIRKFTHL